MCLVIKTKKLSKPSSLLQELMSKIMKLLQTLDVQVVSPLFECKRLHLVVAFFAASKISFSDLQSKHL